MLRPSIFALCVVACFAAVAKKDRIIDQALSDQEVGSPDYDHEAFLGKETAEEFKDLAPEESKRRLGIIAAQIDERGDGDGKISEQELEDWIKFTQTRYIREDSDKQFGQHDTNKDGKIHWTEYKQVTYGFLDDAEYAHMDDDEGDFSYKQMMERDERRWKAACDDDEGCSLEKFRSFLHPEEFDHMKSIVVQETLDDIDKNKDGVVDLSEYIGDMYKPEEGEEVPDWVDSEKQQFVEYRDANKDGKMDLDEVRAWILPDDYNHAEAEAKHLVYEADDDKDGELSIEEVIAHHDKFVGSQVTDWGEALTRHDEF